MEQQMQAGGIKRHSKTKVVAGRKKTYHWFTVTARNSQVLVTSETYKTKPSMEKGISSLLEILQSGLAKVELWRVPERG